jgi:hypothetical protein
VTANRVYGTATTPGAPGTWDRDVWFAVRRARVGDPAGRNRWKPAPPFTTRGDGGRELRVTDGEPQKPYGRATDPKGFLTHVPRTILFVREGGVLLGWSVAWWCGARTAYFRLMDEPDSELCVQCAVRLVRGR